MTTVMIRGTTTTPSVNMSAELINGSNCANRGVFINFPVSINLFNVEGYVYGI